MDQQDANDLAYLIADHLHEIPEIRWISVTNVYPYAVEVYVADGLMKTFTTEAAWLHYLEECRKENTEFRENLGWMFNQ